MDKVVRGEVEEEVATGKEGKEVEEGVPEERVIDLGEEPPTPEFIVNIPNISAIDL